MKIPHLSWKHNYSISYCSLAIVRDYVQPGSWVWVFFKLVAYRRTNIYNSVFFFFSEERSSSMNRVVRMYVCMYVLHTLHRESHWKYDGWTDKSSYFSFILVVWFLIYYLNILPQNQWIDICIFIQGPPKNLPRSIYPTSSIAHPNQTLLYNCVELLDEKWNIRPAIVREVSILRSHYKLAALTIGKLIRE